MKTKVRSKVIISLLIVILILGGILAYLYFFTDIFKSDSQLFFKYLGQVVEKDGFINEKLINYNKKKQESKYEDNGNFYVEMNMNELDEDLVRRVNNFNIQFSGTVDNIEKKTQQDIFLNYSDDVNFPIKYKYANETAALQTDYVSNKYIGIKNENLKEFVQTLGIEDVENIPEKIDLSNEIEDINFTDEERQQIFNNYKVLFENRFKEEQFKRSEENGTINYSLTISNQELKNFIITFLETLKNDSIIIPKMEEKLREINLEYDEQESIQEVIQNLIDEMNQEEIEEGNITIIVTQLNKKLSGITIKNDEFEGKIAKIQEQNELLYTFEMNIKDIETEESMKILLTANFIGLEQMESIKETYQLGISINEDSQEQTVKYTLENTNKFNDNINIEDFNEEEIEILNNYNGTQISNFLTAIVERIIEVNNEQMEEIGFSDYGNPIIYSTPLGLSNILIFNSAENSIEKSQNEISDLEKSTFNNKFIKYEGIQRGTTVKVLINEIIASNLQGSNSVRVSGDIQTGNDDTDLSTQDIESSSTYNVEIKYDLDGYVNEIVITEQN